MRKFAKRLLPAAVVLLLFSAVLCVSAAAAETVDIQLNGQNIGFPSGVSPYYDRPAGRVFVPFRDLFEALDAEVSYDDATHVITATRGETTVTFHQTGAEYVVKTGDKTNTILSDVVPVTINGRVLVPVRFVSNALGAKVGWDAAKTTVLVADAYLINAADDTKYTIFDKMLAARTAQLAGSTEAKTKITGSVKTSEGDVTATVPFTADIETVSSATVSDMKITGSIDLTETPASSELAANNAKQNFSGDLLVNAETGLLALNSDY